MGQPCQALFNAFSINLLDKLPGPGGLPRRGATMEAKGRSEMYAKAVETKMVFLLKSWKRRQASGAHRIWHAQMDKKHPASHAMG